MLRRRFLLSAATGMAAGVLAGTARPPLAIGSTRLDAAAMKAALKTAAPEEDGFVDRCIAMVLEGKISVALVESTFEWARQKPRRKFQYFKQAMIVRAARRGVALS